MIALLVKRRRGGASLGGSTLLGVCSWGLSLALAPSCIPCLCFLIAMIELFCSITSFCHDGLIPLKL
jgi:hypothetical protein